MPRSFRKSGITHAQIREAFDYDPKTGVLTRKSTQRPYIQSRGGNETKDGYWAIYAINDVYLTHHVIWFWWYGKHFKHSVDHIDGDRKNNRIDNLRDVSHWANCCNTKVGRKNSGLIGAALQPNGRYMARIKVVDRQITIGTFLSEQESHEAYMEVKALIHKPEDEGITYEEALERIQGLLSKHRKYKLGANTLPC